MLRKWLINTVGRLSDENYKIICRQIDEEIKANRIPSFKRTNLRDVQSIALKSIDALVRNEAVI